MADRNNDEVIGFIASTVEKLRDDLASMREQMATKEDLARLDGRLSEQINALRQETKEDLARFEGRFNQRLDASNTSIRGDFEQVHLSWTALSVELLRDSNTLKVR